MAPQLQLVPQSCTGVPGALVREPSAVCTGVPAEASRRTSYPTAVHRGPEAAALPLRCRRGWLDGHITTLPLGDNTTVTRVRTTTNRGT